MGCACGRMIASSGNNLYSEERIPGDGDHGNDYPPHCDRDRRLPVLVIMTSARDRRTFLSLDGSSSICANKSGRPFSQHRCEIPPDKRQSTSSMMMHMSRGCISARGQTRMVHAW
jgi:hypothetical protein